jgi:SRSO17 transposase
VENSQVAVYRVYATDAGHALVDRKLNLPRSWTDDPARMQAVGVPDQVGFATKPELATAMLCRALDAGVPAAWVASDEVYGNSPTLRAELEARGVGDVLAVAVTTASGSAARPTAPTRCCGTFRPGRGSACQPGGAPRATATTTGRLCAWTTTARHLWVRRVGTG